MANNVLKDKSYDFALRAIKLSRFLTEEKREFVLSKQVLRSGTSIGANVEEAIQAQSKLDFIHKLSVSQKESFETHYWIRLLGDSQLINEKLAASLLDDCQQAVSEIVDRFDKNGESELKEVLPFTIYRLAFCGKAF
jgi:four helix bundle protein